MNMNIEKMILDIARTCNETKFNEFIVFLSKESIDVQKNICHGLFRKIDMEIENNTTDDALLRTFIAIPIELAIFHQTQQNTNDQTNHLIKFISSHLLARSDSSNEALRFGLIIFYSHINHQPLVEKQKILERFGENILASVFQIYSENPKKSSVAFNFLSENLDSFFSLSPELAAMTNEFLQNFMLKKQTSFIRFITEYKNFLCRRSEVAQFFVIHISFLIRQAFEFEYEILMVYLMRECIEYVYFFKDEKQDKYFEVLAQIMTESNNLFSKNTGFLIQNMLKTGQKISCKCLFKTMNFKDQKSISNSRSGIRVQKTIKNSSPFQKILCLSSGS